MNEQNISNIIEYLDQNPDQTTETLVINLLNEGYPVEDIKTALDRQGISPLVIPGYKETIVYSSPKRGFSGKLLLVGAIVLSIMMLIIVYLVVSSYFNSTTQTGSVAENSQSPKVENNPAALLKDALLKDDYKIAIDSLTVYMDNGAIAKIEKKDGTTYIDWGGIVTILDTRSKTYKTYFSQTPEAIEYNNSKNAGIVPLEIIADTEEGRVNWQQKDSTTWESTNLPKQQLTLDPQTRLVTKRVILNPDGSVSKEEIVGYEKIDITKEMLAIPSDYTPASP